MHRHRRAGLRYRLDRDHRAHARHHRRGGDDALGQRRGRDDREAGAAVAEDVAVVVDRVGDIGRHGDAAGAHDGDIGDHPFRPIFGDQGDPIAGLEAERDQAARQSADSIRRVNPAQRLVLPVALDPEKRPLGPLSRDLKKHRRQAAKARVIHTRQGPCLRERCATFSVPAPAPY